MMPASVRVILCIHMYNYVSIFFELIKKNVSGIKFINVKGVNN